MKEDDMDEMLRKAAANYEVDAGKAADWNAVFKGVHSTEEEFAPAEEKKKRRRFVFWWLLLIPLGWIANTMYNKFNDADKTENKIPVQVESKLNQADEASDNESPGDKASENNSGEIKYDPADKKNLPANTVHQNNIHALSQKQSGRTNLSSESSESKPQPLNGSTYKALQNQQSVTPQPQQALQPKLKNASDAATTSNIDSPAVQQKDVSSASNADTAEKQNNVANASKPPVKIKASNTNHFYAGLMAGMDLSFVKFQQMEPLGYNAGLLVGYKFRKLSIESGLYFVKKNYYTEGEYFDKSGIPYFNDADILTVDGYCQMFEIPLNIKYNLVEKKHHAWFVTAGFSSYLMNKEYYNYDYMKDGEERYGSRAYYHATQNWFSVLNLSAGYQLKTSTKTNLRIEPYFKAPLSGVGTGKLSISSVGVNAGIVRQIP